MSKKLSLFIKNFSVDIDGERIVSNVSLTVAGGEVHVIMGPNGSGKSTFVNALMGHPRYTKVKGTVTLGSKSLSSSSPHEKARAGMFLSMQHIPSIDGITLIYFLHKVNKELSDNTEKITVFYERAIALAKELRISPELLKRPLNTGLSGGEKKQSEILQLCLLKPRFALLDEIDSGVDVDSLKRVWRGIKLLQKEGTGFVLITHYPDILKNVRPDYVHIMQKGKISRSGSDRLMNEIAKTGFEVYDRIR